MTLRFSHPYVHRAILFLALAATCCPYTAVADPSTPPAADQPWFEKALVGMEVGPTGAQFGSDPSDAAYVSMFSGTDIVKACAKAHSEYLVIWARDGAYAYYDSKIETKAPGLGDRDVLKEAVDEARKHQLPIIAYCVLQYPTQVLRKRPEWKARDKDGNPIDHLVCFNSPYVDYVKGLLEEMLDYGIDGFHLDMVDQGFGPPHGCWCESCQKKFEAEYGSRMPTDISWDENWDRMLEFRYRSSELFERELTDCIRDLNPRATVDFNYHGNPPFSWEVGQRPVQHANQGDFVTGETGVWGFGALAVGLNAEWYRAATPGKPFQVAMQRGVRMYHDQTTRPLPDLRWEMMTLLAHGAFVTLIDKTGFEGWLDPVFYERAAEAFDDAKKRRAHFGQPPLAEVGLYYSSRSRDWVGREKPLEWMQSFLGAHKAMVYEHIPFGVLFDEGLTLEGLQRFPVVLLPNAGILSETETLLFRSYVEGGGQLLITGQTGLRGNLGQPLQHCAIADLIGATFVETLESLDNWVRFPATQETNSLIGEIPSDWPFLVKGPAAVYQPTTAICFGELMKPHRTVLQLQGKEGTDWPMSANAPVGPAVLLNTVGKGRVLTLTCSPDYASAGDHHIVEARKLLRNAVRFLNPEPRVEITAPVNVETVVTDDAESRTLRVHLIGYFAPAQTIPPKDRPYVLPALLEDLPIYRASIQMDGDIQEIQVLNSTTTMTRDGNRIDLLVNDIHEVLVIRY